MFIVLHKSVRFVCGHFTNNCVEIVIQAVEDSYFITLSGYSVEEIYQDL